MNKNSNGLRVFSLITLLAFVGQEMGPSVLYAQESAAQVALSARAPKFLAPLPGLAGADSWDWPFAYAALKETYQGTNGRLVIHIQDPHANPSGQKNLALALQHIMAHHDVRQVLVEGSVGDVSLEGLRPIATPADWKVGANRLLTEGLISGEEYLNLTSDLPMKLLGVERQELYDACLEAYSKLAERRAAVLGYLVQIRRAMSVLKSRLYTEAIQNYETKVSQSEGDFKVRWEALKILAASSQVGIDEASYPELARLIPFEAEEKSIDFARASREKEALLRRVASSFGEDALKEWVTANVSAVNAAEAFAKTEKLLEKSGALKSGEPIAGELIRYRDYLKKFASIRPDEITREMNRLEDAAFVKALPEERARRLRAVDRFVGLLEKAYRIQMSSEEFREWAANEPDFKTEGWQAFLNDELGGFGLWEYLVPFEKHFEDGRKDLEAFYDQVAERDLAFVKNARRFMEADGEKTAFLIAGGYHTENLTRLLREEGTSYVVLTPQVLVETDHAAYEKVLLLGLRKSNAPKTSIRLAREDSEEDLRKTLRKPGLLMPGGRLAVERGFPQELGSRISYPKFMKVLEKLGGRLSERALEESPAPDGRLATSPDDLTRDVSGDIQKWLNGIDAFKADMGARSGSEILAFLEQLAEVNLILKDQQLLNQTQNLFGEVRVDVDENISSDYSFAKTDVPFLETGEGDPITFLIQRFPFLEPAFAERLPPDSEGLDGYLNLTAGNRIRLAFRALEPGLDLSGIDELPGLRIKAVLRIVFALYDVGFIPAVHLDSGRDLLVRSLEDEGMDLSGIKYAKGNQFENWKTLNKVILKNIMTKLRFTEKEIELAAELSKEIPYDGASQKTHTSANYTIGAELLSRSNWYPGGVNDLAVSQRVRDRADFLKIPPALVIKIGLVYHAAIKRIAPIKLRELIYENGKWTSQIGFRTIGREFSQLASEGVVAESDSEISVKKYGEMKNALGELSQTLKISEARKQRRGYPDKSLFRPDGSLNPKGIVLVHAAKGLSSDGVLYPNSYYDDPEPLNRLPREIVEFSWNGVISLWNAENIIILMPLERAPLAAIKNLRYTATSHFGPMEIPNNSIVLVREGTPFSLELKALLRNRGVELLEFKKSETAGNAAEKVLIERGYTPMILDASAVGQMDTGVSWLDELEGVDYYSEDQAGQMLRKTRTLADELGVAHAENTMGYPLGALVYAMEVYGKHFSRFGYIDRPNTGKWPSELKQDLSAYLRKTESDLTDDQRNSETWRRISRYVQAFMIILDVQVGAHEHREDFFYYLINEWQGEEHLEAVRFFIDLLDKKYQIQITPEELKAENGLRAVMQKIVTMKYRDISKNVSLKTAMEGVTASRLAAPEDQAFSDYVTEIEILFDRPVAEWFGLIGKFISEMKPKRTPISGEGDFKYLVRQLREVNVRPETLPETLFLSLVYYLLTRSGDPYLSVEEYRRLAGLVKKHNAKQRIKLSLASIFGLSFKHYIRDYDRPAETQTTSELYQIYSYALVDMANRSIDRADPSSAESDEMRRVFSRAIALSSFLLGSHLDTLISDSPHDLYILHKNAEFLKKQLDSKKLKPEDEVAVKKGLTRALLFVVPYFAAEPGDKVVAPKEGLTRRVLRFAARILGRKPAWSAKKTMRDFPLIVVQGNRPDATIRSVWRDWIGKNLSFIDETVGEFYDRNAGSIKRSDQDKDNALAGFSAIYYRKYAPNPDSFSLNDALIDGYPDLFPTDELLLNSHAENKPFQNLLDQLRSRIVEPKRPKISPPVYDLGMADFRVKRYFKGRDRFKDQTGSRMAVAEVGSDIREQMRGAAVEIRNKFKDMKGVALVIDGGGGKGQGLIPALEILSDGSLRMKLWPEALYGTSVGAITAALLGAGYDWKEIRALGDDPELLRILKAKRNPWIPSLAAVFIYGGMHPADEFVDWFNDKLKKKFAEKMGIDEQDLNQIPDITFENLPFPLTVIATDISGGKSREFEFSRERTPNVKVADAVRASLSLPGFFEPHTIKIRNKDTGKEETLTFIDGGVHQNSAVAPAVRDRKNRQFSLPIVNIGFDHLGPWYLKHIRPDTWKGKIKRALSLIPLRPLPVLASGFAVSMGLLGTPSAALLSLGWLWFVYAPMWRVIRLNFFAHLNASDLADKQESGDVIYLRLPVMGVLSTLVFKVAPHLVEKLKDPIQVEMKSKIKVIEVRRNEKLIREIAPSAGASYGPAQREALPDFRKGLVSELLHRGDYLHAPRTGVSVVLSATSFEDLPLLVGALKAIEEQNKAVVEVSAADTPSAVVALLIAAGYTADDIGQILTGEYTLIDPRIPEPAYEAKDFAKSFKTKRWGWVPPVINLFFTGARYDRRPLERELIKLLNAKLRLESELNHLRLFGDEKTKSDINEKPIDIIPGRLILRVLDATGEAVTVDSYYENTHLTVTEVTRLALARPYDSPPIKQRLTGYNGSRYLIGADYTDGDRRLAKERKRRSGFEVSVISARPQEIPGDPSNPKSGNLSVFEVFTRIFRGVLSRKTDTSTRTNASGNASAEIHLNNAKDSDIAELLVAGTVQTRRQLATASRLSAGQIGLTEPFQVVPGEEFEIYADRPLVITLPSYGENTDVYQIRLVYRRKNIGKEKRGLTAILMKNGTKVDGVHSPEKKITFGRGQNLKGLPAKEKNKLAGYRFLSLGEESDFVPNFQGKVIVERGFAYNFIITNLGSARFDVAWEEPVKSPEPIAQPEGADDLSGIAEGPSAEVSPVSELSDFMPAPMDGIMMNSMMGVGLVNAPAEEEEIPADLIEIGGLKFRLRVEGDRVWPVDEKGFNLFDKILLEPGREWNYEGRVVIKRSNDGHEYWIKKDPNSKNDVKLNGDPIDSSELQNIIPISATRQVDGSRLAGDQPSETDTQVLADFFLGDTLVRPGDALKFKTVSAVGEYSEWKTGVLDSVVEEDRGYRVTLEGGQILLTYPTSDETPAIAYLYPSGVDFSGKYYHPTSGRSLTFNGGIENLEFVKGSWLLKVDGIEDPIRNFTESLIEIRRSDVVEEQSPGTGSVWETPGVSATEAKAREILTKISASASFSAYAKSAFEKIYGDGPVDVRNLGISPKSFRVLRDGKMTAVVTEKHPDGTKRRVRLFFTPAKGAIASSFEIYRTIVDRDPNARYTPRMSEPQRIRVGGEDFDMVAMENVDGLSLEEVSRLNDAVQKAAGFGVVEDDLEKAVLVGLLLEEERVRLNNEISFEDLKRILAERYENLEKDAVAAHVRFAVDTGLVQGDVRRQNVMVFAGRDGKPAVKLIDYDDVQDYEKIPAKKIAADVLSLFEVMTGDIKTGGLTLSGFKRPWLWTAREDKSGFFDAVVSAFDNPEAGRRFLANALSELRNDSSRYAALIQALDAYLTDVFSSSEVDAAKLAGAETPVAIRDARSLGRGFLDLFGIGPFSQEVSPLGSSGASLEAAVGDSVWAGAVPELLRGAGSGRYSVGVTGVRVMDGPRPATTTFLEVNREFKTVSLGGVALLPAGVAGGQAAVALPIPAPGILLAGPGVLGKESSLSESRLRQAAQQGSRLLKERAVAVEILYAPASFEGFGSELHQLNDKLAQQAERAGHEIAFSYDLLPQTGIARKIYVVDSQGLESGKYAIPVNATVISVDTPESSVGQKFFNSTLVNLLGIALASLPFEEGSASAAQDFEGRFALLQSSLGIRIKIRDVPKIARFPGDQEAIRIIVEYRVPRGLSAESAIQQAELVASAISWAA